MGTDRFDDIDLAVQDLPCPVETAMHLLTGKWRMLVLYRLRNGPMRFNALQRSLAPVTQKVLTATLRGLEEDGLVWRAVQAQVPPHVTYGLTPFAQGAAPVFTAMAQWILAADAAQDETTQRGASGKGH